MRQVAAIAAACAKAASTSTHDRAKDLAPEPGELARGFHLKKRPPFPGVAVASGYRPHYLASMREIVKDDLRSSIRRERTHGSAPFRRGRHRSTWKTPSRLCSLTTRTSVRRPPVLLVRSVGPCGACSCSTPAMEGRVKCDQIWALGNCPPPELKLGDSVTGP